MALQIQPAACVLRYGHLRRKKASAAWLKINKIFIDILESMLRK